MDPGEIVTVNVSLKNIGVADTTNLVVTLLPNNGVASPSAPQTYGSLPTNGTPVSRIYTFIPTGPCGTNLLAQFQLQDGAYDLGVLTIGFPLGKGTNTVENFDGVVKPALPAGWTTLRTNSQPLWVTTNSQFNTSPYSAFSADAASSGVNELVSPTTVAPGGTSQLSFRNYYNLEYNTGSTIVGYDGGVLEIKIGSGPFTDIITAGGSFVTGGYNRTISGSFGNPLGNRAGWSGNSGGFILTTVNLPPSAAGQVVQFRWRCGTDTGGSASGWWIDSISMPAVACCTGSTPALINSTAVSNNQFQISMLGTPGSNYIIQASTNLAGTNWVSLQTNPAPFSFTETNLNLLPQRFYRAIPKP